MKRLVFCLALCVILLSACGGQKESTPASAAPETSSGAESTAEAESTPAETTAAPTAPESTPAETTVAPTAPESTPAETVPESTPAETSAAPANYEELSFFRDGFRIAGRLYLPEEGEEPFPLVILCHGYGGNMGNLSYYAEIFAGEGYAAVVFDFVGGGIIGNSSDGTPLDMSVLTEKADLEAVVQGLQERPELDLSRLFLLGASQGGFVVTCYAGEHPETVKGLIALYPGYNVQDFIRAVTGNGTDLSETYKLMGMEVGRRYVEDALSFDIKDSMRAYGGPVLIIHGTRDTIAPISYSREAIGIFPNAELKAIEGADHMFLRQQDNEKAIGYMLEYLRGQTE